MKSGFGRLSGKIAVITAGYGDIGRATCLRFCEEGARVFMTGRKPLKEGAAIAAATQKTAHKLQIRRLSDLGVPRPQSSGSIEYLVCDSVKRESIDAMLSEIRRRAGRIDVAIGNAALVYNEPFLKLDPGHWQETMDLNLTGQFHFGQAVACIMAAQKAAKSPGATYATRGNCLCTADNAVRERTVKLLRSFVDLAARWQAVIVVGSLQGRFKEEPNRSAGAKRIREALIRVGEYAMKQNATLAFEPVNHGEISFHNTIEEAAALVRDIGLPGVRLMVDTYHMNIEEKDMLAPLAGIRDILAHVHLSETNRDVLGAGHWDTRGFLAELRRLDYRGSCSAGVYNTQRPRRDCIGRCMAVLREQAGWR